MKKDRVAIYCDAVSRGMARAITLAEAGECARGFRVADSIHQLPQMIGDEDLWEELWFLQSCEIGRPPFASVDRWLKPVSRDMMRESAVRGAVTWWERTTGWVDWRAVRRRMGYEQLNTARYDGADAPKSPKDVRNSFYAKELDGVVTGARIHFGNQKKAEALDLLKNGEMLPLLIRGDDEEKERAFLDGAIERLGRATEPWAGDKKSRYEQVRMGF
jgi:hypothetical protein